jgi:sialic acid synthase SpsE/quercetin dioxygenase-like cupin family protein
MCTPWDEISVDKIVEHGFDFMKVPSCYMTDWPLLEQIVKHDLPIVASTAGEPLEEIDRVVSFFSHRNKSLTIMHCVGEYPAPDDHLHLGQIALLRNRYPDIPIGYSTHERPDNFEAVKIALALGAVMFEKHTGVATEKYALNAYSANPGQVRQWLQSAADALTMIGDPEKRYPAPPGEQAALGDLARGAFVRESVPAGATIHPSNVFYAMPNVKRQVVAQGFSKYAEFVTCQDIPANGPVMQDQVKARDRRQLVHKIVRDVKALLKKSRVVIPGQVELEISHHYGIDRFYEFGIVMITVVNREYCKKLIVVLPNQSHPEQLHKIKEETYHVLYGHVSVVLDDQERECRAGDVMVIPRGARHGFSSRSGCIIEEISSSHIVNDSFYTDPVIAANENRKTFVTYWMD